MAQEVLCKIDTYRDTHYYHSGQTYTVPDDFDTSAGFEVIRKGIHTVADAIEEKIKANSIPRGVVEQIWLRRRCRTDEQKFEVLEEFLSNQSKDYAHKQSRK